MAGSLLLAAADPVTILEQIEGALAYLDTFSFLRLLSKKAINSILVRIPG